jgi:serine/threonine-protein phosphatase 2B regulatory subunit
MGQASSLGLTQHDVEEVMAYCDGAWNQEEIEGLYKRFRSLDRGRKGYISGDEFLDIPELSINPIASRLVGPMRGLSTLM